MMYNVIINVHTADDFMVSSHQFNGDVGTVMAEIQRFAKPFTEDTYKVYISVSGGSTADAAQLTQSVLKVINP